MSDFFRYVPILQQVPLQKSLLFGLSKKNLRIYRMQLVDQLGALRDALGRLLLFGTFNLN